MHVTHPDRWGRAVIGQTIEMTKARRAPVATAVAGMPLVWSDEPDRDAKPATRPAPTRARVIGITSAKPAAQHRPAKATSATATRTAQRPAPAPSPTPTKATSTPAARPPVSNGKAARPAPALVKVITSKPATAKQPAAPEPRYPLLLAEMAHARRVKAARERAEEYA